MHCKYSPLALSPEDVSPPGTSLVLLSAIRTGYLIDVHDVSAQLRAEGRQKRTRTLRALKAGHALHAQGRDVDKDPVRHPPR